MESGSFDTPIGRAIGLLRLDIEHVCAHQGIDVMPRRHPARIGV
jgi:hypothetical protein